MSPTDNPEDGLEAPARINGMYVASVSVSGAVVSIQRGNESNAQITGQTIAVTALDKLGSVNWVCITGGIIQLYHLPSVCR